MMETSAVAASGLVLQSNYERGRMANQRGTFAKRQREMELKDRARAKEARRAAQAARRSEPGIARGPEIAWDQAVRPVDTVDVQTESLVPTDDSAD